MLPAPKACARPAKRPRTRRPRSNGGERSGGIAGGRAVGEKWSKQARNANTAAKMAEAAGRFVGMKVPVEAALTGGVKESSLSVPVSMLRRRGEGRKQRRRRAAQTREARRARHETRAMRCSCHAKMPRGQELAGPSFPLFGDALVRSSVSLPEGRRARQQKNKSKRPGAAAGRLFFFFGSADGAACARARVVAWQRGTAADGEDDGRAARSQRIAEGRPASARGERTRRAHAWR